MTTKIDLNLLDINKFYEISKDVEAFADCEDFFLLTWMACKNKGKGSEKEQSEVSIADFQELNLEELVRDFPLFAKDPFAKQYSLKDMMLPLVNMGFINLLIDSNNAQDRVRYRINCNQLNNVLA